MIPRFVFAFGPSNCGFLRLQNRLAADRHIALSLSQWPLLAWDCNDRERVVKERLNRLNSARNPNGIAGDIATSYLPYAETLLGAHPNIKLIYLQASPHTIKASLRTDCIEDRKLKLNHWSMRPSTGWYHDPVLSKTFPKYPINDVDEAIDRYIDEYEATAERLLATFPDHVLPLEVEILEQSDRFHDFVDKLLQENGVTDQVSVPSPISRDAERPNDLQRNASPTSPPNPPQACVVLVPFSNFIHQDCEAGLKELERRGYEVRRVAGYSAIDQGRNQMATDALIDGFEETLWIDSDIGFNPNDVEKIRDHHLPITCGLYPKKGARELACHIPPSTPSVVFGKQGGLAEILYAGAGFLHVRREVYQTVQRELQLKVCNELFGVAMIPFFQPLVREHEEGYWYLAEDYAFCERARQCGIKIYADTTIRLWHVGNHRYSWENAGIDFPRYDTFTLQIHKASTDVPPSP